jgi:hypothetical protein
MKITSPLKVPLVTDWKPAVTTLYLSDESTPEPGLPRS